jgi:alkyl hydroperoxide reductase subunit AhpC
VQVPEFDARSREFAALNAHVVDISVDSIPSHVAWRQKEIGPVNIPLCADFYPHGEVTQKFSILREGTPVPGISERAAFIVDKSGKVAFAKVYPIDQLPTSRSCCGRCRDWAEWREHSCPRACAASRRGLSF